MTTVNLPHELTENLKQLAAYEEIYEEDPKLSEMFESPQQLFDKIAGQITVTN